MLDVHDHAEVQVQRVCSEQLANLSYENVASSFAVDQLRLTEATTVFKPATCRALFREDVRYVSYACLACVEKVCVCLCIFPKEHPSLFKVADSFLLHVKVISRFRTYGL